MLKVQSSIWLPLGHSHGHRKEGTVLELLRLWTFSIHELFYIEHQLYTAKVWHVAQSLY